MTVHPQVRAALERGGVGFVERRHAEYARPIYTPGDFAAVLGYVPGRIAKTLLLRGETPPRFALAVCPAPDRLDLAAVAHEMGWRRAQFASAEELATLTGYPPTGVSPLGVSGVRVLLAESLVACETVLVGGGAVGVEVELAPADLLRLTGGTVLPLVLDAASPSPSGGDTSA
jgi:Cys-tRNA(Pro)/Cys-tRNA(Cys) deacylase